MKYLELAIQSIANRNHIIQADKLGNHIAKSIKDSTELYHSVYKYDEDIKKHFELNKTIRNFQGNIELEFLIFDIDRKNDSDSFVQLRTQQFVSKLIDDWQLFRENISIWYSGTGYHIYVHNYFGDKFNDRGMIKATMQRYFTECDMALYGATALIRAPYSINLKSGLYKVPLEYDELFGLKAEDIIKIASSNQMRKIDKLIKEDSKDWSEYIEHSSVIKDKTIVKYDINTNRTNVAMCMQTLYTKGQSNTNRHIELMRLASVWRRQGLPYEAVIALGQGYNKSLKEAEVERIVHDVYKNGYSFGCSDFVLSSYCDEKCIFFKRKNLSIDTHDSGNIEDMLIKHAETIRTSGYIDLRYVFNLDSSYKVYDGELVVFFGDTKLGKSMILQNIIVAYPNYKFLLLSLENGKILDSRRMLQIAHGLSKEAVMEYYQDGKKGLAEAISHVKFIDTSVHINELGKIVAQSECDIVCIDTVDQLGTDTHQDNYTGRTEELTMKLRELTRNTKKTVIVIHHISKHSSENEKGQSKPLTIHSGKGSSALEQKADKVIGIEGEREGIIRTIRSLGARDEMEFITQLKFNKVTFKLEK